MRDAKRFFCTLCPYMSKTKLNVRVHMLSHTGEKPFSCASCSFAATTKSALIAHMRTHTGEKPFGCASCSFAATTKSALIAHKQQHKAQPWMPMFGPTRARRSRTRVAYAWMSRQRSRCILTARVRA